MNAKTTHMRQKQRQEEHDHPLVMARLQQSAQVRKEYVAQIPAWRRPLVGYVMAIPLVGLSMLLMYFEYQWLEHFYFSGIPTILAIMFVALIWGLGPALFAVLLGSLALGYFYIAPNGIPNALLQDRLLALIPFIVSGLIVAVITGQREAARIRALIAEREAEEHALELERANQELEQANQMKDHFLSIASHELKTPITTISGMAQMTQRRLSRGNIQARDMSDVEMALGKINDQTIRLNTLVNDLLDLGHIRSGQIPLHLDDCDLSKLCQEVAASQRELTRRDIELEMPELPVVIKADSDRVEQVLTNLVSNALKYSPEDSAVQIALHLQDQSVCISVRDYGQGISPEQQKHIFEAFYRAPDAKTSKKRGWGLGLAICKDIVDRHNGLIWCESQPRKGSTFYVELPVR